MAQRDTAVPLQFDFVSPGARSLGLAGAFTGVADDATAAATNPAGLLQLKNFQEVSVEARIWKYVTPFVRGGRVSGDVKNRGVDTRASLDIGETSARAGGPAFMSYVYPHGRLRLAAYRQELSHLRAHATSEGFFFLRAGDPGDHREVPFHVDRRVDVTNYGVAVGLRATHFDPGGPEPDRFLDVGIGIQASSLSLVSLIRGFEITWPPGAQDLYAPPDYAQLLYEGHQLADTWAPAFNAGLLWRATSRFQVGAAFRRGANFRFDGGFRYPDHLGQSGRERENSDYTGNFKVPDVSSFGVRYAPKQTVNIAFEVSRIEYSQLLRFTRNTIVFSSAIASAYDIPNVTELHFGAEYQSPTLKYHPMFRAGVRSDPDHALTYSGTNDQWRVLPPGESLVHFAFGATVPFSTALEFSAGADMSSRPVVVSFSTILRF